MSVELVNPYYPNCCFSNFPDLQQHIENHYDLLFDIVPDQDYENMTPRWKLEHGKKIGFRDTFYYIDKLYDNNPESVIDVGCGDCIWKNWFPKIIGFDPTPSKFSLCDFVDFFDEDFSQGHTEFYDCGMALNSIHFVSWDNISNQIDLAMNIIKPNGRFLFTINFDMVDKNSSGSSVVKLSPEDKILHFDKMIVDSGYKIIVKDYPMMQEKPIKNIAMWAHINGHVRIILEKS